MRVAVECYRLLWIFFSIAFSVLAEEAWYAKIDSIRLKYESTVVTNSTKLLIGNALKTSLNSNTNVTSKNITVQNVTLTHEGGLRDVMDLTLAINSSAINITQVHDITIEQLRLIRDSFSIGPSSDFIDMFQHIDVASTVSSISAFEISTYEFGISAADAERVSSSALAKLAARVSTNGISSANIVVVFNEPLYALASALDPSNVDNVIVDMDIITDDAKSARIGPEEIVYPSNVDDDDDTETIIVVAILVPLAFVFAALVFTFARKNKRLSRASISMVKKRDAVITFQASEIERMQDAWMLDESELNLEKQIGFGAAGVVWQGTMGDNAWLVAVKILMCTAHIDVAEDPEICFLQRCRHPRLVHFLGVGRTKTGDIFVVLEFMKTSLDCVLWKRRTGTQSSSVSTQYRAELSRGWSSRVQIAKDVAQAMRYLHEDMLSVHRDLKSPNVLVTRSRKDTYIRAKVSDFGLAKIIDNPAMQENPRKRNSSSARCVTLAIKGLASKLDSTTTSDEVESNEMQSANVSSHFRENLMTANSGTPSWQAPELCRETHGGNVTYSQAVDVYSYGIIMWELLEMKEPWVDGPFRHTGDLCDAVASGSRPAVTAERAEGAPYGYCNLMRRCWAQRPAARPSFSDVLGALERKRNTPRRSL